jgi:hypothetical protein
MKGNGIKCAQFQFMPKSVSQKYYYRHKQARKLKIFQNSTQGILVVEWGNILEQKKGLWSTEAKVRSIMPKAAQH